jgi:RNA polymerase sigma-70 factor (sigma-E family)
MRALPFPPARAVTSPARQPFAGSSINRSVEPLTDAPPDPSPPGPPGPAGDRVAALYQAHALGLIRLAKVMTGDQAMAEDIVQDAFLGLYRRWSFMSSHGRDLAYLRASVLNGCRGAYRHQARRDRALRLVPTAEDIASAEESALVGEANRAVLTALRTLPARQREAVTLRFYLGLSEDETAQAMKVSRGTVKSATSRGRAALAGMLKEGQ